MHLKKKLTGLQQNLSLDLLQLSQKQLSKNVKSVIWPLIHVQLFWKVVKNPFFLSSSNYISLLNIKYKY